MSALPSTFIDLDDVPFLDDDDDFYDRCPACQSRRVERHTVSGRQWNLADVSVTWWTCGDCDHEWSDE